MNIESNLIGCKVSKVYEDDHYQKGVIRAVAYADGIGFMVSVEVIEGDMKGKLLDKTLHGMVLER